MIPKLYANDIKVIVLYWSDNSRNVFFFGDREMESFIDWKKEREPELTFKHEIMSVVDYRIKHCMMVLELAPSDWVPSGNKH
jgi:hypothetical protein